MIGGLGVWELLIILVIVILLFGRNKIGSIFGELGSGIRAFREGLQGSDKESDEEETDKEEKVAHKSAVVESFGDHRMAMAFAVLGAAIGGVTINGAECVAKTFPTFWDIMKQAGVEMEFES